MSQPERAGSRLFDACVGLLLAAMALWGAVEIIAAIWRPLTIVMAVVASLAGLGWLIATRTRRW